MESSIISKPVMSKEDIHNKANNVPEKLTINVSKCLEDLINNSDSLKELRNNDQIQFASEVKSIGEKIEQKRTVVSEEYIQLPKNARLNHDLIKPLGPYQDSYFESQEKLYRNLKKLNIVSNASLERLAEEKFEAGIFSAQLSLSSEYANFALGLIKGLSSLSWTNH